MNVRFGRDGAEIGEYPEEEVPALLKSNVIRHSDFYWRKGMSEWELVETRWPPNFEKLKVDARAEVIWGRKPTEVLAILRQRGVSEKDAVSLIEELMTERAAVIRAAGVKKCFFGALFTLAPVAYYAFTVWMGDMSIKLFAALIVLGVYGIGKLTTGLPMIFRPRTVTISLADTV